MSSNKIKSVETPENKKIEILRNFDEDSSSSPYTVSEETEDNFSTNNSSSRSIYKNRLRIASRKKSTDICYTLNLYEKYGNILISNNNSKIFIAKIRKVNFPESQELFEKGKNNLGNYFKEDLKNIPDITFWYQRYYYYRKFDEGIKMDMESKKDKFIFIIKVGGQ
jgi:hypothetical protein